MTLRLVRTDRHGTVHEVDPGTWADERAARREAQVRNERRHSRTRFWVVRPEPVGATIEVDG